MKEQIAEAVREATEPLKRTVKELSARLAALEDSDGATEAEAPKRPARGRTAKAKAQPAEVTAITGDGVQTSKDDGPESAASEESERVPEQRKGRGE